MLGTRSARVPAGATLRALAESTLLLLACGSAGAAIEDGTVALQIAGRICAGSGSGNNGSLVHRTRSGLRHNDAANRGGGRRGRRSRLCRGLRRRGGSLGCRGCRSGFRNGSRGSLWLFDRRGVNRGRCADDLRRDRSRCNRSGSRSLLNRSRSGRRGRGRRSDSHRRLRDDGSGSFRGARRSRRSDGRLDHNRAGGRRRRDCRPRYGNGSYRGLGHNGARRRLGGDGRRGLGRH